MEPLCTILFHLFGGLKENLHLVLKFKYFQKNYNNNASQSFIEFSKQLHKQRLTQH
jgi:hypothetical protein